MIKEIVVLNDKADLEKAIQARGLAWKDAWDNYLWMDKVNYYRLVIHLRGRYILCTQSQCVIIKAHPEIESADWRDYKPYADANYKIMRPCGVEAGTIIDNSWTPMRKAEFRRCSEWINFKRDILYWNTNSNNKVKCEDCGKEFNPQEIEIHHICQAEYDNLDRKKFKLLCRECHEVYTKKGE